MGLIVTELHLILRKGLRNFGFRMPQFKSIVQKQFMRGDFVAGNFIVH